MLYYKILYHSAFGCFTLASDEHYIKMLSFGKHLPENVPQKVALPPVIRLAETQLLEHLGGQRKAFTVPVMPDGTAFSKAVWQQLLTIPYGKTLTYGALAAALGKPKAARAVGGACHRNPIAIFIPCHRVIGSSGALIGFAGGLELKRRLLALEAAGKANTSCQ